MDKVMEKWNEILQMVKEEHGLTDVSFNTWIKPLEVFAIDGKHCIFSFRLSRWGSAISAKNIIFLLR